MKRRELIRHLNAKGCKLVREGANHSWWENLALNRRSAVPRHTEINRGSSRGKSAGIWESVNHEFKARNGERAQHDDVPAAADRFVQRVFEEMIRTYLC